MNDSVVLVGAARTPIGAFNGQFKRVSAPELGAAAVSKATECLAKNAIAELFMGCVLQAGLGQAAARQVVSKALLPDACGATLINRVCGSSMKAIEFALQGVLALERGVYLAAGMENMSLAPHLVPNSRQGFRFGDVTLKDHLFLDGLTDAKEGLLMGEFAERCADSYALDRLSQDEFATESLRRAKQALAESWFKEEIATVDIAEKCIDVDEIPATLSEDKISKLKPAFRADGSVTAANASSLADGAAALAVSSESYAKIEGYQVLAKIRGIASHSHEPENFTTAPIPAIRKLLINQKLDVADIDVWEINEAFAVVPMAAMKELSIDRAKLNIAGGACALGHPLGATGARIVVTLLSNMERQGASLGVASLCIGGGEGMAILLER